MPVYISDNSFPKVIQAPQTVFPSTPDTGTVVMRSDLDYETFFYDGTRWVSTTIYTAWYSMYETSMSSGITAASTRLGRSSLPGDWSDGIYAYDWSIVTYVATTNDGSNYWTVQFRDAQAGTVLGTITTASDSIATSTHHVDAEDATIASSIVALDTYVSAKTGSPGTLYIVGPAKLTYRKVAT